MKRGWPVAAILALLAVPAAGQEADEAEVICILTLSTPDGTAEDYRNIRTNPIPPSMAAAFEDRPCGGINQNSLLAWHLRVGDEATTTAALDFIEAKKAPVAGDPQRFAADLAASLEAAEKDVAKYAVLWTERKTREAQRLRRKSKSFSRLDALMRQYDGHVFTARSFYEAARYFQSRELLARAERHLAMIDAGFAILKSPDHLAPEYAGHLWFDNEGHYADLVLPELMAALRHSLNGIEKPRPRPLQMFDDEPVGDLRKIVEEGVPLREAKSLYPDAELLWAALDADQHYIRTIVMLWDAEAQVEMAEVASTNPRTARCDVNHFDRASSGLAMLAQDHEEAYSLTGYRSPILWGGYGDRRIALLLDKSNCWSKLARRADDQGDPELAAVFADKAIYPLIDARQLVQPDESPTRFRQIASRYLESAKECARLHALTQGGEEFCPAAHDTRLKAYFETNLAALDAIASGAKAPE